MLEFSTITLVPWPFLVFYPPFRDRGTRGGKKPRLIFLRNREIRRGTPGWVKIPELKWCTTTQWNVSWKYRELIFLLLLIFLGDECRHELSAEDDETLIESSIGLISQNCVQVFVIKFDWMFYRFTSKITNHPALRERYVLFTQNMITWLV